MTETDLVALGDELMTTVAKLRRQVRGTLRPRGIGPQLRGAQLELVRVAYEQPGIGVADAAGRARPPISRAHNLSGQDS